MGEIVANNIKKILDERGWTNYTFEKHTKIPKQVIASVLKSKNPTCKTIERIAKGLGVHWSKLVKE